MSQETHRHFNELASMQGVPSKRAAYSDRMAWTMALLAELAYVRFDEESDDILMEIAGELAKLSDSEQIKQRLKKFSVTLSTIGRQGAAGGDNSILKAALEAGGFELAGGKPIHEPGTDTQAFVAIHRSPDGSGFAVICFRGTQQARDWLTNIKTPTQAIANPAGNGGHVGNMHAGFHDAYKSVEEAINDRLQGAEDLPLYITGHSLGGALAVVATWYQSSQRLAACYTFGAPRIGDSGLLGRFKTPIYRIVNAADPVPFVPPAGLPLTLLKCFMRSLGDIFSVFGILDWVVSKAIRIQPFCHYGDMRYLPFADPGAAGDYPGLRLHNHVSNTARLYRYLKILQINNFSPCRIHTFHCTNDPDAEKPIIKTNSASAPRKPDRIDRYHNMSRYRDKLRAIARRNNP